MSLDERIQSLKDKHAALEAAIAEEESHPQPDDIEIHKLKKQKLMIKDELANIGSD